MLEVTVILRYDLGEWNHAFINYKWVSTAWVWILKVSVLTNVIISACVVPFLFVFFEYWYCLKCTFSN